MVATLEAAECTQFTHVEGGGGGGGCCMGFGENELMQTTMNTPSIWQEPLGGNHSNAKYFYT